MVLSVPGTDAEFKFKLGDEITYSEDGKDYTVLRRHVVAAANMKIYLLRACDPTSATQQLQLNLSDESKMTLTDCLSVLTKLWSNLERKRGENGQQFMNYILNDVLGRVCDIHEDNKHDVSFEYPGNSFKMIFDGVEFIKNP